MNVRHCKENAPIYMYYVAPETPMMLSVIADCPDLVPPQYFGQVYAYGHHYVFEINFLIVVLSEYGFDNPDDIIMYLKLILNKLMLQFVRQLHDTVA